MEMVEDYVAWSKGELVMFSELSETSQAYLTWRRNRYVDAAGEFGEPVRFTGNRVWCGEN